MMHALVIDDARAMRLILRQILQKLGFQVSEAGDGREGLDQLRRLGKPDVALVDCHMPEMDGLAFVRAVRTDAALADLRVVMVTAGDEAGQAARALEAGASAYLTKPFDKEAIRAKLAELGLTRGIA